MGCGEGCYPLCRKFAIASALSSVLCFASCTHLGEATSEDLAVLRAVLAEKSSAQPVMLSNRSVAPQMLLANEEAVAWKNIGSRELRELQRRNRKPVSLAALASPMTAVVEKRSVSRDEVVEVSLPVYSRHRDMAIAYFAIECGVMCGGGELVYLVRRDGAWRVERRTPLWRS